VLDGLGVGVAGGGDVGEVGVFGGVGVEPVGVGAEEGVGNVVVVTGDVDDGAALDERAGPGQVGEGKVRHGDHAVLGGNGGGEGGGGEAEDHGGDGDHFVVEVAKFCSGWLMQQVICFSVVEFVVRDVGWSSLGDCAFMLRPKVLPQ